MASSPALPTATCAQPIKPGAATGGTASSKAPLSTADWPELLAEFPSLSKPVSTTASPSHCLEHHIKTTGRPATAKFRRLDTAKLAATKAEFDKMLAAGIIQHSSSQWSSLLHMMRKKDGGWTYLDIAGGEPCSS
jgi:hypothetical protein